MTPEQMGSAADRGRPKRSRHGCLNPKASGQVRRFTAGRDPESVQKPSLKKKGPAPSPDGRTAVLRPASGSSAAGQSGYLSTSGQPAVFSPAGASMGSRSFLRSEAGLRSSPATGPIIRSPASGQYRANIRLREAGCDRSSPFQRRRDRSSLSAREKLCRPRWLIDYTWSRMTFQGEGRPDRQHFDFTDPYSPPTGAGGSSGH